jgi:hypothetical protein
MRAPCIAAFAPCRAQRRMKRREFARFAARNRTLTTPQNRNV